MDWSKTTGSRPCAIYKHSKGEKAAGTEPPSIIVKVMVVINTDLRRSQYFDKALPVYDCLTYTQDRYIDTVQSTSPSVRKCHKYEVYHCVQHIKSHRYSYGHTERLSSQSHGPAGCTAPRC
jgi:hypothetical protein